MARLALGGLLLLSLLAGPGGTAAADDKAHALDDAELMELVAKAASVSKPFLDLALALGDKLTPADLVRPKASAPLTLAVLILGSSSLDERDLKFLPVATPKTFAEAIYPQEVRAGRRVPKHPYASFVHTEYMHGLKMEIDGRTATGTIAFRAPEAYEGTLAFRATHETTGWRIVELTLPHSKVGTTLENERWRLNLPKKLTRARAQQAQRLSLPKVGTVGPAPTAATRVLIRVNRDGWIHVPGIETPLSLLDLQRWLHEKTRPARFTERDGSSKLDVQLDIDASIPWDITQWLMQSCASPDVKIRKIWLGAQTRDGARGAIATHLPWHRVLGPAGFRGRDFIKHKLKVFKLDHFSEPSDLRALYAGLKKRHDAIGRGKRTAFEIVAPPPKGGAVPHGYVVQMIDVCLAVGAKDIIFEGAAMPRGGDLLGSAEALKDYIDRVRKSPGVASVRLNNDRQFVASHGLDLDDVPARGLLEERWGASVSHAIEVMEEELEETVEDTEEILEEEPEIGEPKGMDEPVEDEPLREESEEVSEDEEPKIDPPVKDADLGDWGQPGAPWEGPPHEGSIPLPYRKPRGAFRNRTQRIFGATETAALWTGHDEALDAALRWLAAHQSPNGGWSAAGFGQWCDGRPARQVGKQPDGAGKALYNAGITGLALQAFLGAGYTNRGKHPYAKVVSRGLRYLKNIQDPEGCFGPRNTQQYVYNHAMAALVMVEAYGMTGSPIFLGSAQRALDFIALARNPYFAWRYGIKPGENDTSVTGWMMLVLGSAKLINEEAIKHGRRAPLTIDEIAFEGTRAWLAKVTDPKTGRVAYVQHGTGPARPQELVDQFPGDATESMTAVGVNLRLRMGQDPARDKTLRASIARVRRLPPLWNRKSGRIDMYYWHWGALAMFQAGGQHFETWRAAMTKAIVDTQRNDSDYCGYKGSWDPVGPWGPDGGRIYSTALMALCLEVRYRYARVVPSPR